MPDTAHLRGAHVGVACPTCGGPKYRYSLQCRSCAGSSRRGKTDPRFLPEDAPDAIEVAWAAGFYEGEGTVVFHASSLVVQVGQKSVWPLQRVKRYFGGSLRPRGEDFFMLSMNGKLAEDFLAAIEIHLSPRRLDQINEARARMEASRDA